MARETIAHAFNITVPDELTPEQRARFYHHIDISRRVFEASVRGMLKGVQKYGPEPPAAIAFGYNWPTPGEKRARAASDHWLPHIFSEAVDTANQTALFADALGVEL